MEHEARVFGGYDYDVFVDCTCGEMLSRSHDELSIGDIQRVFNSHIESLGLDNGSNQG